MDKMLVAADPGSRRPHIERNSGKSLLWPTETPGGRPRIFIAYL
jgi:hypothetical protein